MKCTYAFYILVASERLMSFIILSWIIFSDTGVIVFSPNISEGEDTCKGYSSDNGNHTSRKITLRYKDTIEQNQTDETATP